MNPALNYGGVSKTGSDQIAEIGFPRWCFLDVMHFGAIIGIGENAF
jgi:hypothetical protein